MTKFLIALALTAASITAFVATSARADGDDQNNGKATEPEVVTGAY